MLCHYWKYYLIQTILSLFHLSNNPEIPKEKPWTELLQYGFGFQEKLTAMSLALVLFSI